MSQLICGIHAVEAQIDQDRGRIEQIFALAPKGNRRLQHLIARAEGEGFSVDIVSKREMDSLLKGDRHQGIIARVKAIEVKGEGFLMDLLTSLNRPPLVLVLDGVQDPHNLGACLRTANAAGADAVVIPRDRACGVNATVAKVASGAIEITPIIQVTNLVRTLKQMQEAGLWVIGTALSDSGGSLYQARLQGPLAIVLGAEEKGIRRLTAETCDELMMIPMAGTVQSLNVSVAAGVVLYEILRQRLI